MFARGLRCTQTLEEALGVWQMIDTAVRNRLAQEPGVDFRALVDHVVRVTAADFGNDREAALPPPTATVNTIAAHWREAKRSYACP